MSVMERNKKWITLTVLVTFLWLSYLASAPLPAAPAAASGDESASPTGITSPDSSQRSRKSALYPWSPATASEPLTDLAPSEIIQDVPVEIIEKTPCQYLSLP